MSVCVLEGWMTAAECAAARLLVPELRQSTVNKPSALGDEGEAFKPGVRRSMTAFLTTDTEEKKSLLNRVQSVVWQANREVYEFDLVGTERLQLAEYGVGDEYGWHTDVGPGASKLRKLSVSIQLTDPAEYDGGDLEIWGAPRPVPRTQGTLVIFPSHSVHRVKPVTRGVRHSLVAWAVGSTGYR